MKRIAIGITIITVLTLVGCNNVVTNKQINTTNIIDKKVQQDKVELQESKIQEINKLKLTNEINYKIYFEKFIVKDKNTHTDIFIEYPQIKNMKALEVEKKVNKLLKEKAISVYGGNSVEGLSLPMKTEIEYFNSNIISVKYTGYGYYFGTINGDDIMYATNINLKTGQIIDIHNLFTDHFQQKLNRNVFKFNGLGKTSEGNDIDSDSLEYGYVNGDEGIILEMFKNYYSNKAIDKYYFSDKCFNIIAKTPSGPTMYLELSASYDDLRDCMNYNNGFWNDILKLK